MKKTILVFQYTNDNQFVPRRHFMNKFPNLTREANIVFIDNIAKLVQTSNPRYIDTTQIFVPSLNDFTLFDKNTSNSLMNIFLANEKVLMKAQEEKDKKLLKKLTFTKIIDLNNGDKVVYRDRENPNRIGRVSKQNGTTKINGVECNDCHPFSYKNIRVVQHGDTPNDYFLDDIVGLKLYQLEENYPHGTTLDILMQEIIN